MPRGLRIEQEWAKAEQLMLISGRSYISFMVMSNNLMGSVIAE